MSKPPILETENNALHLIAAKNIETEWRKKDSVPVCPCCKNGLHAEDFRNPQHIQRASKKFSMLRRSARKE